VNDFNVSFFCEVALKTKFATRVKILPAANKITWTRNDSQASRWIDALEFFLQVLFVSYGILISYHHP
jgi:hypothetical protein